MTAEAADPQAVIDGFEKRLVGEPDSSLVWIKYMSAVAALVGLAKARAVAERALQAINFRKEGEKTNVWVAYLNLEHACGSPESLKAVFDRSVVYCDARHMYMQLARIYAATAGRELDAIATFKGAVKKFPTSCKVWLAYLTHLYATDVEAARKILPLATRALPKRKHDKITVAAAQLEYKKGSIERGRTIFEGVIARAPNRTDIVSIHLTMEENLCRDAPENVPFTRRLFERCVHLRLSSKKAKTLFKRFLVFEKVHGSEATVAHVKDLARQYVNKTA